MTDRGHDDRDRPASESEWRAEALDSRAIGPDMARVLAHLADQPAPRDLIPVASAPTWEGVQAVLSQVSERADDGSGAAAGTPGTSAFVTPQAFYAEAMRRPDIRRLLRALDE